MTDPIQFRKKVENGRKSAIKGPAKVIGIKGEAIPDPVDAFQEQLCADELQYAINKACLILRPTRAKLLLELMFSNAIETLRKACT